MAKRLFLLIIAGIMGATLSSETLMATDDFAAQEPVFHAVETVPLPEPEPESEPEVVAEYVAYNAPAAGYEPVAAYVPQTVNYTVTFYSSGIEVNPDYYNIYKTGKLIYGHNSGNLLGDLAYRYVGEVITITEGGVIANYQVTDIVTYEKTADGYLNGDRGLMGRIMRSAMGHTVALMTCAGTSYGNGDASHRLVVYADAI